MKKVILLMSCKDGWEGCEKETKTSVLAVCKLGAHRMIESGSSDVSFARSRALSFACEAIRGELAECDVVLMVDDDMEFSPEMAQEVVDKCRELGRPTSAAYATLTSKLAAMRWRDGLWCCGLGLFAIPVPMLLELEARSESFELFGKAYSQFTWSGADRGQWFSEDFRLCIELGGAVLLPLGAAHIKKAALLPDDETIEQIRRVYDETIAMLKVKP